MKASMKFREDEGVDGVFGKMKKIKSPLSSNLGRLPSKRLMEPFLPHCQNRDGIVRLADFKLHAHEVVDSPAVNGCDGGFRKVTVLPSSSARDIAGLLTGVEVAARTSLPVKGRAVVNFRWGVRVPTEIRRDFDPTAAISLRRFRSVICVCIYALNLSGILEELQNLILDLFYGNFQNFI